MAIANKFMPSDRDRNFLDSVESAKYNREIITGLQKFVDGDVPQDMQSFYSREELDELMSLSDTVRDIQKRMPVKITRHYFEQARKSKPLQNLIKASPKETFDLDGSPDPGKQMSYSPVEGLIHKYELGLIYVAATCSAHCRFCYREELIAKKEVERPDGTIAPKGLAQVGDIVAYVEQHNREVAENGGRHPVTNREKLREILMSGGDPLVLANRQIATWLCALAGAGIESIRIGTKELAFHPDRVDESFVKMLDGFHELYPEVALRIMVHFNHPDEFLAKTEDGAYIQNEGGTYRWLENTKSAVSRLRSRNWITIENQSPIIKGINDDPDALRILQRELKRNGVGNHYFFCGRDIVGHKAFNIPIEEAWRILNESQKGLSGVEAHARLSITHYKGKTEVAAVTNEPIPGLPGAENGVVILKLLRSAESAPERCKVTIVGRNPEAIWFSGYDDRVLLDEAGLYSIYDIPLMSEARQEAEAA